MRRHIVLLLLAVVLATQGGCFLHPPYGEFNDNTTIIPPMGKFTHRNNLPPAQMLAEPGPGVGGPGPGVMMPPSCPGPPLTTSQVAFTSPEGMSVQWDVGMPGAFDSEPLIVPGRYNFPQGAIYRLKLGDVPGRPGVELYPTLEVGPPTPRTEAYLAHNAIPVQFTEEDFDQVLSGNFVTKVIYLPDPEFQELAIAGVETLVSTRLDPGVDPIVEADRRGTIMAIVRVGNKDLEVPGAAGGMVAAGDGGAAGLAMAGCPGGAPGAGGPIPIGFVSGVTVPQYGMPTCGTPIGLPGPPHVPLGVPAGLQKHVIANHTKFHIPPPVRKFKVDVKEEPGFSYPQPVKRVHIKEKSHVAPVWFHQPVGDKREHAQDVNVACPDGATICD